MTVDQAHVLDQLVAMIQEEEVDLLIIAGDVYDRSIPPVEAVELLDRILSEIIDRTNTKIVMIPGNHDSADRLGFASKLLEEKGLYIQSDIRKAVEPIRLSDEEGEVNIFAIPFCEPALARLLLDDEGLRSHDDVFRKITGQIHEDYSGQRNICIAHCFAIDGDSVEVSDSVRPLTIGGTEYVDANYFLDFAYTALGHLHRPQKVKVDKIRYAGSLLKYSFSETDQKKSLTLVEMDVKGAISYEQKYLIPKRDMRKIRGELRSLISEAVSRLASRDDYIMALLTDEGELIDPIQVLRDVYPNVLRLERDLAAEIGEATRSSASSEFLKKDVLALFEEFYENVNGESLDEEKKEAFKSIVNERL